MFSRILATDSAAVPAIQAGVAYLEYNVSYPNSAHTFLLRSAYHQRINTPGTDYLTIAGTCLGYAAYTRAAPVSGMFEGSAALTAETAVSLGLTTCTPPSLRWSTSDYFDSSDALLGHAQPGNDYDVSIGATGSLARQRL